MSRLKAKYNLLVSQFADADAMIVAAAIALELPSSFP